MTSLLPVVNLPLPIRLHALGLCALGLKLTFIPPSIHDQTILGIATTAIGLCYISTAYMAPEKNAILYASAPIRIILASLAGVRLALDRFYLRKSVQAGGGGGGAEDLESTRRNKIRTKLLAIMLYDGLGGLWLGWWLGTYSGRIPEYQT